MTQRRIWIINHYASTPATGIGGRHHNFARLLAQRGHQVTVIAARRHHILRDADASTAAPFIEEIDGYRFVRLTVPRYAGAHDKRRVLAWFCFCFALLANAWRLGPRPDAILISSLSLVAYLPAEILARWYKARLIFEVRDLWPLSLTLLDGVSPKHPFVRFLQWIENRAYQRADQTIATLPAAKNHMLKHGLEAARFAWVPNGVRGSEMALSAEERKHPSLRAIEALARDHFVITYTGTLGQANALEGLLEALAILKRQARDQGLAVALVGQGALKAKLQARAQAQGLSALHFLEPVSPALVPALLAASQACILCWNDQPLYRFGISANKLAEYMMAGRPIIHAYSGACDPVADYNLGLSVPAEDSAALAEALRVLADTPADQRRAMGAAAKELAERCYSFEALLPRYEALILGTTVSAGPTAPKGPKAPAGATMSGSASASEAEQPDQTSQTNLRSAKGTTA